MLLLNAQLVQRQNTTACLYTSFFLSSLRACIQRNPRFDITNKITPHPPDPCSNIDSNTIHYWSNRCHWPSRPLLLYIVLYILKYILYFQDSDDDSSGNAAGTRESHETTGYVKVSTKPLRNCKNMRIEYDILPRRGSHGKSHYVIETWSLHSTFE